MNIVAALMPDIEHGVEIEINHCKDFLLAAVTIFLLTINLMMCYRIPYCANVLMLRNEIRAR